jgi:hypothetical protein
VRRIIADHGPSIVYLPRPPLSKTNLGKVSAQLTMIAEEEGRDVAQLRDEACRSVLFGLAARGEQSRFDGILSERPEHRED